MSDPLLPYADLSPADRDRVREIYLGAFPEDLTAPFEDLLVDRLLVHRGEDAVPDALALVRDLVPDAASGEPDTGWTFLRYFAAGPRGGGVGSRTFAALTGLLADEGRRLLVWDVEDPDEPGLDAAAIEEHTRRIAFYERNGARLLPVRGYHPPHEDGHAPAMRLMWATLGDTPEPGLREVVVGVLRWRYGCDADHPAVRRCLTESSL